MLKITSDLKAAPGNSIIYEKKSGKKKKKKPSPWEVQIQLWKIHKGDLGESISGNLTAPHNVLNSRGILLWLIRRYSALLHSFHLLTPREQSQPQLPVLHGANSSGGISPGGMY